MAQGKSGKSDVWKFFKVCSADEKKAECSLCDSTSKNQIVRGKSPKLFSTKPLWNHLKSKHPLIMKTLDEEVNASKDEDDPLASSSSSTTIIPNKSESRQTQPTLQSVIKKKEMWSLDDSRSINITKKIGEMIALDAEAFALVERKGFERLIKFLAPQYPLPSRTYFSEKIMPQLYENLKTRICKELTAAKYISFSTDIWTCSANNEAFISLTAHFIRNDDVRREIYVLSAKHFLGSHTGVNIGQILYDIMEEWHINSNQIHLILRDNAANMIVGTGIYV